MSKKAILDLTSSSPCMRKQEERDGKGKETVLSTDREEMGYSGAEVARFLGVTTSAVNRSVFLL